MAAYLEALTGTVYLLKYTSTLIYSLAINTPTQVLSSYKLPSLATLPIHRFVFLFTFAIRRLEASTTTEQTPIPHELLTCEVQLMHEIDATSLLI